MKKINSLSHFENLLKNANTIKQLNLALKNYLAELHITTFSFTYYAYHPNSQNKLKYDWASENFLLWHKHYISEGYEDVDSTLAATHQTTLPTFWNLQQQLAEAKTPREKQMRQDSIDFGAEQGLTIPLYGPDEDFAILLVVQMLGEECLNDWPGLQYELLAAGYYYNHYLKRQLLVQQPQAQKYQLTQREMQCLLLTAKQRSVEEIAEALGITERTVNFHIQKTNKKLGVKNKYQAVAKALEKRLLVL